jgi:hypothetical protein
MLGEVLVCRTGRDMPIYSWRSYAGRIPLCRSVLGI